MSIAVIWKSLNDKKYILEVDKKTLEEIEDYLFWKILLQDKVEDEFIDTNKVFELLRQKKNEVNSK